MIIETRPESIIRNRAEGGTPLHLKHAMSPSRTIELDLDSLHNAGFGDFSFVQYPLAGFAAMHSETVATIYAHDTPSTNSGYFHNAVFLGVIGNRKKKILELLKVALGHRRGVPDGVIEEYMDLASPERQKVRVGDSPDSIVFEKNQCVYHIEDGRLWAPYETGKWYTDEKWL